MPPLSGTSYNPLGDKSHLRLLRTLIENHLYLYHNVAKVLSLKELPDNENDKSLTLSTFLNKGVYIESFVVSQNDMFESVKRVTGTTDADWMITHEDTRKRYEDGLAQVKVGNMAGFSKMLYARAFYPDDSNHLSEKAQNDLLGLPDENLDESTKVGIDLVKELQLRVERMASQKTASTCTEDVSKPIGRDMLSKWETFHRNSPGKLSQQDIIVQL